MIPDKIIFSLGKSKIAIAVFTLLLGAPTALGQTTDQVAQLTVAPQLKKRTVPEDQMGIFSRGDNMQTLDSDRLRLTGRAEVRRNDSVVKGDQIDYNQRTTDVKVRGNGLLMQNGTIIQSPEIDYNLDAETGEMKLPEFWMGDSSGAGQAEYAEILSRNHMRLDQVQYSACPCPEPAWYIRSPQVDLHNDENTGLARHGVLYFKGVPIMYSPLFGFPLREERKSGFLSPIYGYSSNSGLELSVPYYFNLAPNYDATLTPRLLSKRGLQWQGEFRYLQPSYSGTYYGEFLPDDRKTHSKRWLLNLEHRQRFDFGGNLLVRYRKVSDDDYFRDLSTFGLNEASVRELSSTARLSWSPMRYVSTSLSATKYQTLQDATSSRYRRPSYDMLPRLGVTAARYNWGGFDIRSENTLTRFVMPYYSGRYDVTNLWNGVDYRRVRLRPNSTRLSSYTTLSLPYRKAGWYITPQIGLHYSHYRTDWNAVNRNEAKNASRFVPLYSLDAGMTFERDTRLFGHDAIQTLEPRLFYLYVPYVDQDDIPVLDTSVATFNFAQAFSHNLFSGGWDRIANANQLTVGLTTRWLNAETGAEIIRLQAAQRLYFEDRRVFLSATPNLREHPVERARSDYLFGAAASLTQNFHLRFDTQINPETRGRNRMNAGIRWEPKRLASLNLSYRYERDPQAFHDRTVYDPERNNEQVSFAGQWPLTNKLYLMGRTDYSLHEKRSTQNIFGLEYKGDCCWTARFVVQRYAVSARDSNSAVFLQLELGGLGALGTDPMRLLREQVTGYRPVTTPIPKRTVFERYE